MIDSKERCARVRVWVYASVCVCVGGVRGERVMGVIVVAMSARIEAASAHSVAVVLFAGIFR